MVQADVKTKNPDPITDMVMGFVKEFDPDSLDAPAALLGAAHDHVQAMSRDIGSNSVTGFGEVLAKAGRMQSLVGQLDQAMASRDDELVQDLTARISELVQTQALSDDGESDGFGLF